MIISCVKQKKIKTRKDTRNNLRVFYTLPFVKRIGNYKKVFDTVVSFLHPQGTLSTLFYFGCTYRE